MLFRSKKSLEKAKKKYKIYRISRSPRLDFPRSQQLVIEPIVLPNFPHLKRIKSFGRLICCSHPPSKTNILPFIISLRLDGASESQSQCTTSSERKESGNMAACHIRKNLAALRQFPRVALNNIRDLPEAFKPVGSFLSSQVKCFYKQFKI